MEHEYGVKDIPSNLRLREEFSSQPAPQNWQNEEDCALQAQQEIQDRALAVMVNEASHILDEGVAARPLDVDMVKLFGYGFPRWRGGPMMAADIYGADRLLSVMEQVAADDPGSWEISPLFRRVAQSGKGFASLNA